MDRQNKKKLFEVFQGKFKLPPPILPIIKEFSPSSKVVVFDLDETLGSFSDLYLLWTGTKHIYPEFNDFIKLLDLYPEFLRHNILVILQYLYTKKLENKCDKIYIYTNNQCLSREWVSLIMKYFNDKISSSGSILLFDKVISAFKIGNTSIELGRTSHEKIFTDLICCTMLPKNTEVCFIDDTEFIQMKQDKVYYICPKSYVHPLNVTEIVERLIESNILLSAHSVGKLITSSTYWYNWFSLHKRPVHNNTSLGFEQDILISKKIMCSIREFFVLSTFYEHKSYNMHHSLPSPFRIVVKEEVIPEEVKEEVLEEVIPEETKEEVIPEEEVKEEVLEEVIPEETNEEANEEDVKENVLEEVIPEQVKEEAKEDVIPEQVKEVIKKKNKKKKTK